ncbi:MAG: hypothetical protein KDE27_00850 [Planctomycetes bacterium]|nr:hypothetical protein [Planctomycetota bacterium]
MNPRLLLLLLAIVFGAGAVWLFTLGDDEAPHAAAPGTADTVAPESAPTAANGDEPATPTEADTSDSSTAARDAVATRDALVPIPADAQWIEVRIVEDATDRPLPGATVLWSDGAILEALQADPTLLGPEDVGIRADVEQIAARFGWRTTADDRGVARVHRTESTQVAARLGELYGTAKVGTGLVPPNGGFEVRLAPDRELLVRVVSAAGEPAFGVPVALRWQTEDNPHRNLLTWQPLASTRAPDGIAHLPHSQLWRDSLPKDRPFTLMVATHMPGFDDPGVGITLEALPSEPVELRLPACGRVGVRAELDGAAVESEWISLYEQASTAMRMQRPTLSLPASPGDWTWFENVPIGRPYGASTRVHGGSLTAQFDGPVAAGGEVRIVLAPNGETMMLTGRLVDRDRRPLVATEFRFRVRGGRNDGGGLTTDDDGRFVMILGRARNGAKASTLRFDVQRGDERPLVAELPPRELHPGTEDVGDVVLGLGELVLAGSSSCDGEPCRLPQGSSISRSEEQEGREPRWRASRDLTFWSADDGTFEFRGSIPAGRLRLNVGQREFLPVEPIEFAAGTRGLKVELERGATLQATMLLPDADWQSPVVTLAPATAGGDAARKEVNARVWKRDDGRQQAKWERVEPGSYTLRIRLTGVETPIHEVPDVRMPPPAGGDPRLVDIDLTDRVLVQTVRIFDPLGEPIENVQGGVFPNGQDENGELRGVAFVGATSRLLLPRGTTGAMVGVEGYRPAFVDLDGTPLDLRLEPWPRATVVFANLSTLAALPAGAELQVRLRPGESERRWRIYWRGGTVGELLGPPSNWTEVKDGRAEIPVGDEPRALDLRVRHRRKSATIAIAAVEVSNTTPNVRVDVPAAGWDAALAKLAEAEK